MAYDYYRRALCPFCGAGEMRAVNACLARCSGCQDTMSHGFYEDLLRIRALPEAEGTEVPRGGDLHRRGSQSD
jgi:ribosomal protein L37AE/L43A